MKAIQLKGISTATVTLDADAIAARDQRLALTKAILVVEDNAGLVELRQQVRTLKDLSREVETARVAVKSVPLKLTRDIDSSASQFVGPVEAEIKRLEAIANKYASALIAAQQEAERKAKADREAAEKKIEDERKAKLEEVRKENEKKLNEQEAARAAQGAPKQSAFAAARLAMVLSSQEEKIDNEAEQAKAVVADQTAVAPIAVPVKKVWKWEVLDLVALTRNNIDLVRIEPNTRLIQTRVNAGVRSIPGLRIWEETEAKL